MAMRILHVVHQYVPEHMGGTELNTQALAQAQQRAGHRAAVLAPSHRRSSGLHRESDEEGVTVWWAGIGKQTAGSRFAATYGRGHLLSLFEQCLKEFGPDVVHIQHLMGWPAAIGSVLLQMGIPYVITVSDYWWVCANGQRLTNDTQSLCDGPQRFVNCGRCALARSGLPNLPMAPHLLALPLAWRARLLSRSLASAAGITGPADFVAAWYRQQGLTGVPIQAIPSASPQRATPRPKAPRPLSPVRFLYVGGLVPQKGVHLVVEAMQGIDGAELWVAGDPATDPDYTARLGRAATPSVRFLGRLDREQLWHTLAQVDALLFPSIWHETYGLVVDEAFSAGVPVLVSDLGAARERIRPGVDGLQVVSSTVEEWRRLLDSLAREPRRLAELAAGVRPPTSLAAIAQQTMALYEKVLRAN